jgi:hypothetical protein
MRFLCFRKAIHGSRNWLINIRGRRRYKKALKSNKRKAPQVGLEPTTLRLTVAKSRISLDCCELLQTAIGVAFGPARQHLLLLRAATFDGGFLGMLGTKMGTAELILKVSMGCQPGVEVVR